MESIHRRRRLLLLCLFLLLSVVGYRMAQRVVPGAILPTPPHEPPSEPVPKKPVVLLDPGHGGGDGGAVGGDVAEKDITLAIALQVRDQLQGAEDFDVEMTREIDVHISASQRVQLANELDATLIISIHVNSFDQSYVRGTETFYRSTSEESKDVAIRLHKSVLAAYEVEGHVSKDRDVRPGNFRILVLPRTQRSVLLEIGYISNREDRAIMLDASFQARLAENIAVEIKEIMVNISTD